MATDIPPPQRYEDRPRGRPRFDPAAEQQHIARALRRGAAADAESALPHRVLQSYCDSLTSLAPRIALAWIWFGEPEAAVVEPQICAGRAADYARGLRIERNWLTAKGPVFRAIDGRRSEIFAITPWSVWRPWREVARRHGIRSVIALRLESAADPRRGLLVMYSDTERYFDFLGASVFHSVADLFGVILSRQSAPGAG